MVKRIDIGCGPKPQKGYDAYIDIYMNRSVRIHPEIANRFTKTCAEDLSMFKDKEFDFAWCHHVIEHVQDPNKACAEIMRIAKTGVFYFPTVSIEILCGRDDHNWMVFPNYEKKHLLFIKKRFKSFYGQGGKRNIQADARPWICNQSPPFEWKDSFTWTVVL